MTFDRTRDEDILIDTWVALESLFVPEKSPEINYRVSLRIAFFLGTTPEDRVEISKNIRYSYGYRSTIAHGGERKKKDKLSDKESLKLTREALRKSLIKICTTKELFDPENIEHEILIKLPLAQ
ncbi:hypothetical protein D3C72_1899370 [compost metagenome]